ncbi:MAG: FeoB-associated Cys-rich membrane protein [Atopobiaceae bacterium]
MNILDVLIIVAVVFAFVLAVRSLIKGSKNGCAECGSRGSCTAALTGGACPAAEDMLSKAEKAVDDGKLPKADAKH